MRAASRQCDKPSTRSLREPNIMHIDFWCLGRTICAYVILSQPVLENIRFETPTLRRFTERTLRRCTKLEPGLRCHSRGKLSDHPSRSGAVPGSPRPHGAFASFSGEYHPFEGDSCRARRSSSLNGPTHVTGCGLGLPMCVCVALINR